MSSPVETMKSLLDGLYEGVEENESIVRKEGRVSRAFCDICDRKGWEIVPLAPKQQSTIDKFSEWARKYQIISLNRDIEFITRREIQSKNRIIKGSRKVPDENVFKYIWDINSSKSRISKEIRKIRGLKTLISRNSFQMCPHFHQLDYTAVRIKRVDTSRIYYPEIYSILIGCEECTSVKINTRCESVYKDGFLYHFRCSFRDLILKQRVEKMGLSYETGERELPSSMEFVSGYRSYQRENMFYFKELNVLLSSRWEDKETIKHLQPSLLVTFSPHTSLPDYLEYDTNVLFYDEGSFSIYDKEREVEQDISVICDRIISDLNQVMDGLRGNDHDRTISALDRIGSSMGYVPKTEFSQPGVRIDLVWYDREGKIQVACEVETSSTWKKDLISTWEVEPRLAIIVGFTKTDRVAKNLMSITLMKYVPHPLLYINKVTGNAFLFEKNNLIKGYELKTIESEKGDDIKVL